MPRGAVLVAFAIWIVCVHSAGAQDPVSCSDFESWREAQIYSNEHPGIDRIDSDADGWACEWMTNYTTATRSGLLPASFTERAEVAQEAAREAQDEAESEKNRQEIAWNVFFLMLGIFVLGYFFFMTVNPILWPTHKSPPSRKPIQVMPDLKPLTARILELQQMEYATEYLNSPEWKRTRARVIQNKGAVCNDCRQALAPYQIEVHHIYYEDSWGRNIVGREEDRHLLVLCAACHGKRHGEFDA